MSPHSNEEHKVVEMHDESGNTLLDWLFRIVKKKAEWWCPSCNCFHAYTGKGSMECPFGNEIEDINGKR